MIDHFHGKNRFLSNFYPVVVEFESVRYPSVEHAYQAAKTPDTTKRWLFSIANALTAGDAKRVGKNLVRRPDWEQVKLDVMTELVRKKFGRQDMARCLLLTGDEELIESNTWGDCFWGICGGRGDNHLGKILMMVRDELKLVQLPLAVDRS